MNAIDLKTRVRSSVALGTMLLAGCATGPAYVKPTVDVPTAFKEQAAGAAATAPAQGWKSASPQDAQDRGAWWEVYNDAKLNQLEARVSVSNQTIVMAVVTAWRGTRRSGCRARGLLPPGPSGNRTQPQLHLADRARALARRQDGVGQHRGRHGHLGAGSIRQGRPCSRRRQGAGRGERSRSGIGSTEHACRTRGGLFRSARAGHGH